MLSSEEDANVGEDAMLWESLSQLTPDLKIKLYHLLSKDSSISTSIAQKDDSNFLGEKTKGQQKLISSLRRANAKIQDELHQTLVNYRDAELSHKRAVGELEKDLEGLRSELDNSLKESKDYDEKRRKLIKEKMENVKENNDLANVDREVIGELQERVLVLEIECSNLKSGKKENEKEVKYLKSQLDSALEIAKENEEKAKQTEQLTSQLDASSKFVEHLKEELEFERSRNEGIGYDEALGDIVKGSRSFADEANLDSTSKQPASAFSWSNFITTTASKVWQRDMDGLRNEISDLTLNKDETMTRIKENVTGMIDKETINSALVFTDSVLQTGQQIANGDPNALLATKRFTIVNHDD